MMDWTVLPLNLVNCFGFVMVAAIGARAASPARTFGPVFGPYLRRIAAGESRAFSGASWPLLMSLLTPLDTLDRAGSGLPPCWHHGAQRRELRALCMRRLRPTLPPNLPAPGDYAFAARLRAQLAYDGATHTLSVAVGARGTIHTYQLEPPSTRGAVPRPGFPARPAPP